MNADMTEQIRGIIRAHGRLAVELETLKDESDLYQAGLSSHSSVSLMLALEEQFEVEFPERMLRRRAFASVAAIRAALEELTGTRA